MKCLDDVYNAYERCFENDICVGCPYSDLLKNQEGEIVYPLRCMHELMHDVNQCIKDEKLIIEVLSMNPHRVILRKAYEKTD